jgi:hypothetical protein
MLARKKRYGLNSIFAQKLYINFPVAAKGKLYILVLYIEIIKGRTTVEQNRGQRGQ